MFFSCISVDSTVLPKGMCTPVWDQYSREKIYLLKGPKFPWLLPLLRVICLTSQKFSNDFLYMISAICILKNHGGLNVVVSSSRKFMYQILTSNMMVFGGGALGQSSHKYVIRRGTACENTKRWPSANSEKFLQQTPE